LAGLPFAAPPVFADSVFADAAEAAGAAGTAFSAAGACSCVVFFCCA